MTTYTTITNALVAVGAKPFATTIQALRDNPLAIAEGDVTAPSLLPAIANKSTAGGVGTYALARRSSGTTDVAFGATLAGSSLSPASTLWGWNSMSSAVGSFQLGSALSGTWMAMGDYDHTSGAVASGATLWLRIA